MFLCPNFQSYMESIIMGIYSVIFAIVCYDIGKYSFPIIFSLLVDNALAFSAYAQTGTISEPPALRYVVIPVALNE